MSIDHVEPVPRPRLALAGRSPGADPCPQATNLNAELIREVQDVVLGLDNWFDSMHQLGGYSGPVVHWWRDCLDYTGPGLDWRYEGIIIGYLNLWAVKGDEIWLHKARRAGDDLVAGQLPSGNYRNSQFELNPGAGGTPHEAACDLALLRLAEALRSVNDSAWYRYSQTAERNLRRYYVERLWDERTEGFRDSPSVQSFVPNKAATLAEALLALAQLSGESVWAERYALPTLVAVMSHQVQGGKQDGAIYQNSFGSHRIGKFFPYYVARCIPGLLQGSLWSNDQRLVEAAKRAAGFVLRCAYSNGSFPQVVHLNGRCNRYPQWIAGTGDILRALELVRGFGVNFDRQSMLRWLLAGRRPDGGFRTAYGFGAALLPQRKQDWRDDLSVCGWADKCFRYLTSILLSSGKNDPSPEAAPNL